MCITTIDRQFSVLFLFLSFFFPLSSSLSYLILNRNFYNIKILLLFFVAIDCIKEE